MHNPKLDALRRESASNVERLFGVPGPAVARALPAPELLAAQADEESPLVRKSYCILRGWRQSLSRLRLISRQGEIALVDYGSITWVNFRQSGDLVLRVNDGEPYTVTLRGQGLGGELLDGLQRERVEWIRELDALVAAGISRDDPEQPVVTGIHIAEGSVSRAWSRNGSDR